MDQIYYLDSCIWLNLFKKEGDASKGTPYWKIAKDFIAYVKASGGVIAVSRIVLKEVYFQFHEDFAEVEQLFAKEPCIGIIEIEDEDYALARSFERTHGLLSFYDYLHLAIAQRRGFWLITRDRALLEFARKHITALRPEDV